MGASVAGIALLVSRNFLQSFRDSYLPLGPCDSGVRGHLRGAEPAWLPPACRHLRAGGGRAEKIR
eukprot:1888296-Alexandrium_andersonii.AAC.1